jgi:hypothetical protein
MVACLTGEIIQDTRQNRKKKAKIPPEKTFNIQPFYAIIRPRVNPAAVKQYFQTRKEIK